MSEAKTLKFTFTVDEASLQKTRGLIRDLTADLTKLNEAAGRAGGLGGGSGGGVLPGLNVGGTPRSPETQRVIAKIPAAGQGLAQNLMAQKDMFKGLATGSKESMTVMTDALKRAVGDQRQQILNLRQSLEALATTYERVGAAASGALGQKIQIQGPGAEGRARMGAPGAMHPEIMPEVPWPGQDGGAPGAMHPEIMPGQGGGGGGPPGRWQRFKKWSGGPMGGPMGGMPAWVRAGARIGGIATAAGAAVNAVGQNTQAVLMGPQAHQAARNQMFAPAMQGMAGGDLSWGLAMVRAREKGAVSNQVWMHSLRNTNVGTGAVLGVAGNIASSLLGGAGLGAGSQQAGGIFGGLTGDGLRNAALRSVMGVTATEREAIIPKTMMALQRFSGGLSERLAFQRITGAGGISTTPGPWAGDVSRNVNPYGDLKARLEKQGFAASQWMGSFAGLRNMAGGKFAGQNAMAAMAADAQGYHGFGATLGASARRGAGNLGAYGAIGGGVEKAAGISLAQGVLGSGFDPMGTTSGLGTLAAIQNGAGFTRGAGDFNRVQSALAGLQLGSNITTGGLDPYQQGRNLVGAIGILGGGASTYAQDFLGNGMNIQQMMDMAGGGAMTKTATALGLTRGNVSAQLGDSMSSVLDRFVDESANDPLSKAVSAFRASGQSMPEHLKSLAANKDTSSIEALGAGYGLLTGAGEESGVGLARTLSGLGGKLKGGKIGGGISGAEKAAQEAAADITKTLEEHLKNMAPNLEAAAKSMEPGFKAFSDMTGDMGKGATDLVDAMTKMTQAFLTNRALLMGEKPPVFNGKEGGGPGSKAGAPGPPPGVHITPGGRVTGKPR